MRRFVTRLTAKHCLTLVAGFALSWCALVPSMGHAKLYTYVDKAGVTHFTNVRPGGKVRYTAQNESKDLKAHGDIVRLPRKTISHYDEVIIEAANYYSLPPALVKAVVAVESNFEPSAVSHAGACGLMQLMPGTARLMDVSDSFDPWDNIYGGTRYLRILANRFGGDLRHTLAGYNAGPEAVVRSSGVPPYAETQQYVKRVLALYQHYLANWQGALAQPVAR